MNLRWQCQPIDDLPHRLVWSHQTSASTGSIFLVLTGPHTLNHGANVVQPLTSDVALQWCSRQRILSRTRPLVRLRAYPASLQINAVIDMSPSMRHTRLSVSKACRLRRPRLSYSVTALIVICASWVATPGGTSKTKVAFPFPSSSLVHSRVLEVHDVYTVPTNEMLFLNYSDSSACTSTPPESNRKSCKPVQM